MSNLPQTTFDFRRREFARKLENQLHALLEKMAGDYGFASTKRVRYGILNLLRGGSTTDKANSMQRPAFFSIPNLVSEPFISPPPHSGLATLISALEANYEVVRASLLQQQPLEPHVYGTYMEAKFLGVQPDDWLINCLYNNGSWTCPISTRQVLESFTDLFSGEVIVSRLRSSSSIPPHVDDNNYQITLHFGLSIPEGDCGIRVGDEARRWIPGKCLLFSDTYVHEVWNYTASDRDILLIDLWHPDLTEIEKGCLKDVRAILAPATQPIVFAE